MTIESKVSPFPWSYGAAMHRNFRHVRHILDAGGDTLADVRYLGLNNRDADPRNCEPSPVELANTCILTKAPELAQALRHIEELLRGHPDVKRGNSTAHYAYITAINALKSLED